MDSGEDYEPQTPIVVPKKNRKNKHPRVSSRWNFTMDNQDLRKDLLIQQYKQSMSGTGDNLGKRCLGCNESSASSVRDEGYERLPKNLKETDEDSRYSISFEFEEEEEDDYEDYPVNGTSVLSSYIEKDIVESEKDTFDLLSSGKPPDNGLPNHNTEGLNLMESQDVYSGTPQRDVQNEINVSGQTSHEGKKTGRTKKIKFSVLNCFRNSQDDDDEEEELKAPTKAAGSRRPGLFRRIMTYIRKRRATVVPVSVGD